MAGESGGSSSGSGRRGGGRRRRGGGSGGGDRGGDIGQVTQSFGGQSQSQQQQQQQPQQQSRQRSGRGNRQNSTSDNSESADAPRGNRRTLQRQRARTKREATAAAAAMAAAVEPRPKTDEPIPDEETVMSTFRELLNQKDAEAGAIHGAFRNSGNRDVFQASMVALVARRQKQQQKQQVVSSNENILSLSAAPLSASASVALSSMPQQSSVSADEGQPLHRKGNSTDELLAQAMLGSFAGDVIAAPGGRPPLPPPQQPPPPSSGLMGLPGRVDNNNEAMIAADASDRAVWERLVNGITRSASASPTPEGGLTAAASAAAAAASATAGGDASSSSSSLAASAVGNPPSGSPFGFGWTQNESSSATAGGILPIGASLSPSNATATSSSSSSSSAAPGVPSGVANTAAAAAAQLGAAPLSSKGSNDLIMNLGNALPPGFGRPAHPVSSDYGNANNVSDRLGSFFDEPSMQPPPPPPPPPPPLHNRQTRTPPYNPVQSPMPPPNSMSSAGSFSIGPIGSGAGDGSSWSSMGSEHNRQPSFGNFFNQMGLPQPKQQLQEGVIGGLPLYFQDMPSPPPLQQQQQQQQQPANMMMQDLMPNLTQQQPPGASTTEAAILRDAAAAGDGAMQGLALLKALGGGAAFPPTTSTSSPLGTVVAPPALKATTRVGGETPVELVEHGAVAGGGTGGGTTANAKKPSYAPKRVNEEQQGTIHVNVRKNELLSAVGGCRQQSKVRHLTVKARARMVVQWQLPMKVAEKLVLRAVTRKNERRTTSNAGGGGRRSRSNSVASGGETEDSSKAENGDGDGASTEVCLVIGLVRLGMATNKATVVNKQISVFSPNQQGNSSVQSRGRLEFHAPRSAGVFVYRLFDENDSVTSYATSVPFAVGVQQRDLDHNLKLVTQQLKAKKTALALRSLAQCFEQLQGPVAWLPSSGSVRGTANQNQVSRDLEGALHGAIMAARAEFKKADAELANQAEAAAKAAAAGGSSEAVAEAAAAAVDGKTQRVAAESHGALRSVLVAAEENPLVWGGLGVNAKQGISHHQALFCPLSDRFLPSPEALRKHYSSVFGFTPRFDFINARNGQLPRKLTDAVTASIQSLVPSLFPSPSFLADREALRKRLEAIIVQGLAQRTRSKGDAGADSKGIMAVVGHAADPLMPPGASLQMFGSSRNNFGNDSADLDMCLMVPSAVSAAKPRSHSAGRGLDPIMVAHPPDNKAELVEAIEEVLAAASPNPAACVGGADNAGMPAIERLTSRPTARIPVVNFEIDGKDCDISVHNPLALRNSDLLAVYSRCDPRVRPLAFVVKHWTKRRRINNASEGTLSSYGYLLCLVHYLQTRNPPVVPNLQALPPDWDGDPRSAISAPAKTDSNSGAYTVAHPVDRRPVETYFYQPPRGDYSKLNAFGARNKESLGELLAGFFRHFGAADFQYADHAVSIRSGGVVEKLIKAEIDCWPSHLRLAIEDPFETWYDVAHPVKKQSRYEWIRAELMRAFSLLVEATESGNPAAFSSILDEICAEAPAPPFLRNASKEKQEQELQQHQRGDLQQKANLPNLSGSLPGILIGGGLDSSKGRNSNSSEHLQADEIAGQQLESILSGLSI